MSRDEQDAYFTDALEWLRARHGAENVLSAVIHRDESIHHMTVMTIPLPHLKPSAAADGGSSKTAESGQAIILDET